MHLRVDRNFLNCKKNERIENSLSLSLLTNTVIPCSFDSIASNANMMQTNKLFEETVSGSKESVFANAKGKDKSCIRGL